MLTPLDIQNHKFRHKMRGYDPEEVRQFLHAVAEETEKLIEQNHNMSRDLDVLRARIHDLEHRDKILKDTLISAQEIKQEIKENAIKEAELLVREGQIKSDQLVEEAKQEVAKVNIRLREMRRLRNELLAEVEMMVARFTHFVEAERDTATDADKVMFVGRKPVSKESEKTGSPQQEPQKISETPPKRRKSLA